jgi:hypothetical protein
VILALVSQEREEHRGIQSHAHPHLRCAEFLRSTGCADKYAHRRKQEESDAVSRRQEQRAEGGRPSDFERERFERHADFLIDQGYMAVDPLTLAVRIAWKLRSSQQPEELVYEDEGRDGLGRPFRVRFTKPISRIGFV